MFPLHCFLPEGLLTGALSLSFPSASPAWGGGGELPLHSLPPEERHAALLALLAKWSVPGKELAPPEATVGPTQPKKEHLVPLPAQGPARTGPHSLAAGTATLGLGPSLGLDSRIPASNEHPSVQSRGQARPSEDA